MCCLNARKGKGGVSAIRFGHFSLHLYSSCFSNGSKTFSFFLHSARKSVFAFSPGIFLSALSQKAAPSFNLRCFCRRLRFFFALPCKRCCELGVFVLLLICSLERPPDPSKRSGMLGLQRAATLRPIYLVDLGNLEPSGNLGANPQFAFLNRFCPRSPFKADSEGDFSSQTL